MPLCRVHRQCSKLPPQHGRRSNHRFAGWGMICEGSLLFRGCKFHRKAVGDIGGYKCYLARDDRCADGALGFT